MIEKSIYENYKIDFSDNYTSDDALFFIFNDKRELLIADSIKNFDVNFNLYFGTFKGRCVNVVNVNTTESFKELIEIYNTNHDLYQIASRAVLINDWYLSHQFCGRCGMKTVLDDKDMMLKCPECGQVHYPRIAPAIIVAIVKDDKLLMAKHSYHKTQKYALIAGFVEPGESIEDAVRREVAEEVGIKIKNLKYLKSQSWPFPNSLMLAFEAEYESGEISVDGDEIVDARWFKKEEIVPYDSDISISYWLVDRFLKK